MSACCKLCGKKVPDPCVPLTASEQPKQETEIVLCGNFQDLESSPRGKHGGLLRTTVEVDPDFDMCIQEAERELLPEEVRKYVPHFALAATA